MADINNSIVPQQFIEVDSEEILREYGLEDIQQTSTVITQNGNSIVIPNELEPPTIDSDVNAEVVQTSSIQNSEEVLNNDEEPVFRAENIRAEDNNILTSADNTQSQQTDDAGTNSVEDILAVEDTTEQDTVKAEETLSTEEILQLLPVNSKSFEIDERMSRFSGASWFNAIQETTITLAGVGGIGSWTYGILSRMNPKQIFIYDNDVVELANLSGQMYFTNMVGVNKVDAMFQFGKDFSDYYKTVALPIKFTSSCGATDIMICGFDNMTAREVFFNAWLNHVLKSTNKERCLYIDGRLSMEEFQVFCITGDDTFNIQKYNDNYLFKDYMAQSEQCSMKQTTYCSNMIGSIIVNLFTNFVANVLAETKPLIDRDLPFKTYYNASMMYLKTEI